MLATLEAHTVFVCERPAEERKKLRSVQAVMDAFPDVRLVIDAKEQRVQRPGGSDESGNSRQKPFYSGKKKTHTLKTQVRWPRTVRSSRWAKAPLALSTT